MTDTPLNLSVLSGMLNQRQRIKNRPQSRLIMAKCEKGYKTQASEF